MGQHEYDDRLMIEDEFEDDYDEAGGLENESTVDHSGNAVVKTQTLSLAAREPHGCETIQRTKDISVVKRRAFAIFDLSLLAV